MKRSTNTLLFLTLFLLLILQLAPTNRDYPDIRRDMSQMRGDRKRIQESEEMRFWTRK